MSRLLVLAAIAATLVGLAYIRLAPSDPDLWHVIPEAAIRSGRPNDWLVGKGGDALALVLPMPPDDLAARMQAIALATPRTQILAGQGRHVTYITRSALFGFPDYTSVLIRPLPEGSELTVYAHARFGSSDAGVNRARVTKWLALLAP